MPIPLQQALDELCLDFVKIDEKCITFVGGAEICFQFPRIPSDNGEAIKSLLAQVNAALAPLTPIFNIIDAVIAAFNCLQAIPDAITNLDPTELIECVPDLVEKVTKLLALIPQLSLPLMLIAILDCIIMQLEAVKDQLLHIAQQYLLILQRGLEAAEPGNAALRTIVDCAQKDMDVYLEFVNEGFTPLNRLIGLVSALLGIIGIDLELGIDKVLDLSNVEAALRPLSFVIDVLTTIRNVIPIP